MKPRPLPLPSRSSRLANALWNSSPLSIDFASCVCRMVGKNVRESFGCSRKLPNADFLFYCRLSTVDCKLSSLMDKLTGIHAIREALDAGRPFDRILIARGRQDTRVEEIVQLARARDIPVRFEDRGQLDRLANTKDHQGVVAL